jgi:ribA/ribD-fused uncharacterized protein
MGYTEREYNRSDSFVFCKTKEEYGGLSNMASGYPLTVNGITVPSSEALYQSLRYPELPELQMEILSQRNAMAAKIKSREHIKDTRQDWEEIKVQLMRWCIQVKLACNFDRFGRLLHSTIGCNIVEYSSKDTFWGACDKKGDPDVLVGVNALGRLLMGLRADYLSPERYNLVVVKPPEVKGTLFLGSSIQTVDNRKSFIRGMMLEWGIPVTSLSE